MAAPTTPNATYSEPDRAVQPQLARYLHDMAEGHAEGQRHQQQTEEAGRLEKDR
jgi:hypothetical protein